jgi:hypothetical protein
MAQKLAGMLLGFRIMFGVVASVLNLGSSRLAANPNV